MAHILETFICLFLCLFVGTSWVNVGQEIVGPRLWELDENSMNSSPTSAVTAVSITRNNLGKSSSEDARNSEASTSFDERKIREEISQDIENINNYMKMIAEEMTNDGVVIVHAVKTSDVVDPLGSLVDVNDYKESAEPLRLGTKSSPNVYYLPGFQDAKPRMCKKPETKFSSTRSPTRI